jgi:hypothetical protein
MNPNEPRDKPENVSDSIHVNREFDSIEMANSDLQLQPEKDNESRISRSHGISKWLTVIYNAEQRILKFLRITIDSNETGESFAHCVKHGVARI